MRVARLVLVVCFFGCQTSSPEDETSSGGEGNATSLQNDGTTPQASGECPASFAQGGGYCDAATATECTFPEGTCSCGTTGYCGGIDPGPNWAPGPPTWRCNYGPGTTRPDGCPGQIPETGAPCQQADQACGYGDCCISTSRCVDGAWQTGGPSCPP